MELVESNKKPNFLGVTNSDLFKDISSVINTVNKNKLETITNK